MHWRRKWQHSSVLPWRIPGTEEPGGLPSTGSQSQTRLKPLSNSISKPMMMWTRVVEVKDHSERHMQWVAISFSFRGIFLTNPGLLHCRQAPYQLSPQWHECSLQHLFNLAKTWKQVKGSSAAEWIKKMWHVYIFSQWNILLFSS